VKLLKGFRRTTNAEEAFSDDAPLVIGVAHDVAMSGDASDFAAWLFANTMNDPVTLQRNRERIDFAWEGFDNDPRELWEIPEVVAFVKDLNDRWPCALYFMTRQGHGLQVMQFCLLAASAVGSPTDGKGTVRVTGPGIGRLLEESWFPGLNQVCELADLGPSDVRELTESAQRYLSEGPAAG
jgi:hypothetical protein